MTYPDPANPLPDLEPGRNPPKYRKAMDDGWGTGTLIGGAVGFVLIVGLIVYALSGPTNTAANNPPAATTGQPATTGQSGTQVAPPVTAPPTDQGVPPGAIAPPTTPKSPNLDSK